IPAARDVPISANGGCPPAWAGWVTTYTVPPEASAGALKFCVPCTLAPIGAIPGVAPGGASTTESVPDLGPSTTLRAPRRALGGHGNGTGNPASACALAAAGSSLARAAASSRSAFSHPPGVLPAIGPAGPDGEPPCLGPVRSSLSGVAARADKGS